MDTSLYQPFYSSSGICTDTRRIEQNCLFICIKGENFDGNTFASEALNQGAAHVIVDNPSYFEDNGKMTLVDNSVTYLQQLANYHRKKFNIPVIGITGSNGKTTTKELINAVLSKKYNVLATIGNLNNHLGVPFTLLRLTDQHEIAIIEMGANRFKDIQELSEIAEPTHGIITNIGKAHLEGFGGFEGVLKTKKELYDNIEKSRGTIVINEDDPVLMNALPSGISTVTYGEQHNSTVNGELLSLSPFVKMKWSEASYTSGDLSMQMIGKYNYYNYLAAAAFGHHFDVPNEDISKALEEYTPTNNRSQVKETKKNTLILDCYNANPTSMKSALESFAAIDHEDKVCILGSMKELGDDSELEHKKIMELVNEMHLDTITVGPEFQSILGPALIAHFDSTEELKKNIEAHPLTERLILLKGSRSIGLEQLEEIL